MITITAFDPDFEELLPAAYGLLQRANLVVHDSVDQVFIAGSRGLAGGYRTESDVDLSLVVTRRNLPDGEPAREEFLRNILATTLNHWQGIVEIDIAAVFDLDVCCGLRCFLSRTYDPEIIRDRGKDCFGVYKVQRGFNGYVRQGVDIARMYPLLCIWRKDASYREQIAITQPD